MEMKAEDVQAGRQEVHMRPHMEYFQQELSEYMIHYLIEHEGQELVVALRDGADMEEKGKAFVAATKRDGGNCSEYTWVRSLKYIRG